MKYILSLLFLISCGNSEVQLKAPEEDILSGETYSYIILRVEYITEIRQQCENLYPAYEYDMNRPEYPDNRKQDIATCFFDNMIDINVGELEQFNQEVCSKPIEEQTAEEIQACTAINGD